MISIMVHQVTTGLWSCNFWALDLEVTIISQFTVNAAAPSNRCLSVATSPCYIWNATLAVVDCDGPTIWNPAETDFLELVLVVRQSGYCNICLCWGASRNLRQIPSGLTLQNIAIKHPISQGIY